MSWLSLFSLIDLSFETNRSPESKFANFDFYLHQLRLFIEYKIVALRGLSINFFEQVILKAPLLTNSNIQEDFVTPPQAVYTQLVLWENIFSF